MAGYTPARYFERLKANALERCGECLSPAYVGVGVKLRFRCASGHVWETTPLAINAGHWCPKCFRERRKIGIGKVRAIARSKGGECLSTVYVDAHTKLRFQCARGHTFLLEPRRFSEGRWCPGCTKNASVEVRRVELLRELQAAAKGRGGKCLSRSYLGHRQEHSFRCAHGHTWQAAAIRVSREGSWCPKCAREKRKLGLELMREMARREGGKCLSESYPGSNPKLRFRCAQGHVFSMTASCVQRGQWCFRCAMAARALGLGRMRSIAKARGGACLSTKYVNNHTHLTWLCADGHAWRATSKTVKNKKSWCPECARGRNKTRERRDWIAQRETATAYVP